MDQMREPYFVKSRCWRANRGGQESGIGGRQKREKPPLGMLRELRRVTSQRRATNRRLKTKWRLTSQALRHGKA